LDDGCEFVWVLLKAGNEWNLEGKASKARHGDYVMLTSRLQ